MTEDETTGCHLYSMDMSLSKFQETVKGSQGATVHGGAKSQTEPSN